MRKISDCSKLKMGTHPRNKYISLLRALLDSVRSKRVAYAGLRGIL